MEEPGQERRGEDRRGSLIPVARSPPNCNPTKPRDDAARQGVLARGGSPVWLRTAAPPTCSTSTSPAEGFGHSHSHSHEGDMDLAMLVTDFLENNGAAAADSRASTDSESGLADTISMLKRGGDDKENELLSMVHSLLFSVHDSELQPFKRGQCSGSCIRHLLAKLLTYSGYDAAVCSSKWQGFDNIPGGDHEYIDVIMHGDTTGPERLIVDIDFRIHFEIARAVASYGTLLSSLPVVYVGTLPRLKQFLHVMVDAARWSLKQNSMPLPPWRSLPYLQAKWQSKYERKGLITEEGFRTTASTDYALCIGHLKRLKTSLQSELEAGSLLMVPIETNKKRMPKFERQRRRSLLSC